MSNYVDPFLMEQWKIAGGQPQPQGNTINSPSISSNPNVVVSDTPNYKSSRLDQFLRTDSNQTNSPMRSSQGIAPQSARATISGTPGTQDGNVVNMGTSGEFLSNKGSVTQEFGNRSSVEKYSGGVNYGTDIAVPRGTKVSVPNGNWIAVDVFSGATAEGPNNRQGGSNRGYGNSVLLQNTATGEKLRFSHLTPGGVGVKRGQKVSGGDVVGRTGATGNTAGRTGQHVDIEYYNSNGRISNVRKSPYAQYIFGGN